MPPTDRIAFAENAAQAEASMAREASTTAATYFDTRSLIARRPDGRVEGDHALFGFWTTELLDALVPSGDIFIEILSPLDSLDLMRAQ
ncbi:hypothetical protein [Citreimonas salinaria]|uniref:Uncharacterized protein n=1 Tax=Citreimonas salinaria TaxID=321339 RepID=A0A1H3F3F3_9RHOB|nr:hypothetical protein [Citreimonas salinaria]SDX85516.1 hypothetical protein SAMN05444340_101162 [Citreimonas salinaria]